MENDSEVAELWVDNPRLGETSRQVLEFLCFFCSFNMTLLLKDSFHPNKNSQQQKRVHFFVNTILAVDRETKYLRESSISWVTRSFPN